MKSKSIIITFLYIIGTIGGLYFNKNIALFFCLAACLSMLYFKKKKYIIALIIIVLVAFARSNITNNYIKNLQSNCNENYIVGNVVENKNSKKIMIDVKKINGKNTLIKTKLYVYSKKNLETIVVGNKIMVKGKFSELNYAKNTGNFDYKKYMQSKKIIGLINADTVEVLGNNKINIFNKLIYELRASIRAQFEKYLPEKNAQICCALVLGEKDNLSSDITKSFSDAGISHIIAVSGMHTAYIASVALFCTKKLGKKASYYCTIIVLIIFCNVAYNSESVFRATTMLVLYYLSKLVYCKSNSLSNLSVAILASIILNPFCIYSIGLIMSSAGTLGIINFYNEKSECKQNSVFKKIMQYIKNQIKIGFSANLILFPIIAIYYNRVSLMFIVNSPIINFLMCIIMPVLILFSTCGVLHSFCPVFMHQFIGYIVTFLSNCLIYLANFFQKVDIFNFKSITPSAITIITYYVILFLVYSMCYKEKINKKTIKKAITVIIIIYVCVCIISNIFIRFDDTLKIHFIDVGQGDSTFITTPDGKRILIDGGGNENGEDTVGEKILIPFLLNKSVTKIDYILISHFDTDHVGGILTVIEQLNVGTIVISKQNQESENYSKLKELVKIKKINVIVVKQGDKLRIEENLYFDILWPSSEHVINENILNNNSLVCNLHYKNFSMMFTGDIEKIAEQQIINNYQKNSKLLRATVLKAGHHGSKTSSMQKFVEMVNPRYAVIGVGVNNKFNHPSDEIIVRFKNMRYRCLQNR